VETAKFEKRWFQTIKGKCRKCRNPSCLRPDRDPTPERPPCGKKASKGLATTTARAIVIAKRLPITTWISLFPCCCWNCAIRSDWGRDRSMGCCLLLLCLLLFRSWRHPASSAATFFLAGRSVSFFILFLVSDFVFFVWPFCRMEEILFFNCVLILVPVHIRCDYVWSMDH